MRTLLLVVLAGCSSSSSNGGTLENRGAIVIDSRSYRFGGQTYGQGSVNATFLREQEDPFFGCKLQSFGDCSTHVDCQPILVSTPDLATASDLGVSLNASAGTIHVAGLLNPLTLTLMSGQYAILQQSTPLFQGGEALTISAAGAEVPAFSGLVTTPSEPTVTAPLQNAMVSRNQDLAVSWSGGGAGQLRLSLSAQQMTGVSGFDCVFRADAGAGIVPKQALQLLPAGNVSASLSVVAESFVSAGAWQVDLAATTGPLAQDGTPLDQLNVILQ